MLRLKLGVLTYVCKFELHKFVSQLFQPNFGLHVYVVDCNITFYCQTYEFICVVSVLEQIYERFVVDSVADADDARLDHFIKKVALEGVSFSLFQF